jgi:hypothetical protein
VKEVGLTLLVGELMNRTGKTLKGVFSFSFSQSYSAPKSQNKQIKFNTAKPYVLLRTNLLFLLPIAKKEGGLTVGTSVSHSACAMLRISRVVAPFEWIGK